MTKIDLENLPYPMFVTTDEEKKLLRKLNKMINLDDYFLCPILKHDIATTAGFELASKIRESLVDTNVLSERLGLSDVNISSDDWYVLMVDIRKIWIKKLLAYSPETN